MKNTWVGFLIDAFLRHARVEIRMRLELEKEEETVNQKKNLNIVSNELLRHHN